MSASPSQVHRLFIWTLCVAACLSSNMGVDSYMYEIAQEADSHDASELFTEYSLLLRWDISSLAAARSDLLSRLRFLCDLILPFLEAKSVMTASFMKSKLERVFASGWPDVINFFKHFGHSLVSTEALPARYMTVFPETSAFTSSTRLPTLEGTSAMSFSALSTSVTALNQARISLGAKRGYSDLAHEGPGILATPEHLIKTSILATPNTGRAEASGLWQAQANRLSQAQANVVSQAEASGLSEAEASELSEAEASAVSEAENSGISDAELDRCDVAVVKHVSFPPFCEVLTKQKECYVEPFRFKLHKEFESFEKFKAWLKSDLLLSSVGLSSKGGEQKVFDYFDLFCNHKIPIIGESKRQWSRKYIRSTNSGETLPQHKCPWRGRGRLRLSDGAFALYTPMYASGLFEEAVNKFGGFDESTRTVCFEEGDIPVFITECLHVHGDGRGCLHIPDPVLEKPEKLHQRCLYDRNFNHVNFENTIKEHPDFDGFHGAFQKIKRLVSQRPMSPPPRTSQELIKRMEKKLKDKGICVVLDTIPDDDKTPVIVRIFDDELGEAYYLVTRGSLLKRGRMSLVLHCDATFNVMNDSKMKLLGVSFQDAKQKPYPVGFMIAERECKRSYDALLRALKKGFDLVTIGVFPQGDNTEPVCHVKHVMFDGLNYGDDLVKTHFGENCMRSTCYFHVLNCLHKYGKTVKKLDDQVLKLLKAIISFVSTAPSSFSIVSLWSFFEEVLPVFLAHEAGLPDVIKMISSSYMNFSKKNDFIWFSSAVHRKNPADPHGPISCRSNNPIESTWSWFKRSLHALSSGQKPRNVEEMLVFLSEVVARIDDSDFCERYNVLENDYGFKLAAMLQKNLIVSALNATERSLPDINDRFFVLMRDTRELIPLAEPVARSLIGEFIEERGAYTSLSPQAFQARVAEIDKLNLLVLMQTGYIIQFRLDALPGTKDSFALGTCTCRSSTVKTHCVHLLAVHLLMHLERRRLNPQSVDENELAHWPSWATFLSEFGLPAGLPPGSLIEADPENLFSSELSTLAVDQVTLETVDDLVGTAAYKDKLAESPAKSIHPRRVDAESFTRTLCDGSKGLANLIKNGIISRVTREKNELVRDWKARGSQLLLARFWSLMNGFCEEARISSVMTEEKRQRIKPLLEHAQQILI